MDSVVAAMRSVPVTGPVFERSKRASSAMISARIFCAEASTASPAGEG